MDGAIFDMDGLLFDTETVWQKMWHETARERGIELSDRFKYEITGTSGEYMLEIVKRHFCTENAEEIVKECRKKVHEETQRCVEMKTGVREILKYLKDSGFLIAVASSSSREQILHNLELGKIKNYFDAIVSGVELLHGKPAPDIFLKAAEQIKCRPEDCYVFEDAYNGVKAGYAAGCRTIMVPDLLEPTDEIRNMTVMVAKNLIEARNAIRDEII